MIEQIFLSQQVKRSVIIINKHGIYELPCELPNDVRLSKLDLGLELNLRLRILEN